MHSVCIGSTTKFRKKNAVADVSGDGVIVWGTADWENHLKASVKDRPGGSSPFCCGGEYLVELASTTEASVDVVDSLLNDTMESNEPVLERTCQCQLLQPCSTRSRRSVARRHDIRLYEQSEANLHSKS